MNLIESFLTKNPCWTANVNKADSRYIKFQTEGPKGGMLHSVGCAQPSAMVFIKRWNSQSYTNACVHGFIDANTGDAYQTLKWNYRGWHGGGACNNTHIGIEMCESAYIHYTGAAKFEILDLTKAQADCRRSYNTAVELFAMLAKMWNWNVDKDILSHAEGYRRGIATNHGDPEHYWRGLNMPYTMDGFRADVKKKMEDEIDMTKDELNQLLKERDRQWEQKLSEAAKNCKEYSDKRLVEYNGKYIHEIGEVHKSLQPMTRKLLDCGAINGGTTEEVNPDDINLPMNDLRSILVAAKYTEYLIRELLEDTPPEDYSEKPEEV